MKTSAHPSYTRAVVLVTSALLCNVPGLLKAEEPMSPTAQRLDQAADHEGEAKAATELSAKFTSFAGSTENATALVTGLRNGTTVTLTSAVAGQTVTTAFQPAGGKLGYGNAFISLALAQESLAKAGLTQPSPAQIEAALNGGTVTGGNSTPVSLAGVLTLRAAGDGWGDIAKTLGVKLGPVVSALHNVNREVANPGNPTVAAKTGPATPGPETRGKPDNIGRPAWAGHSGLPNPRHIARPGRP